MWERQRSREIREGLRKDNVQIEEKEESMSKQCVIMLLFSDCTSM